MDERYQIQLLMESPLFDAEWYKNQHPDVESKKLTPEQHYLRYGWRMGRNPSVSFCSVSYQEQYPDVVQNNENPLIHYLNFGRSEGREVKPVDHKKLNIRSDIDLNKGSNSFQVSNRDLSQSNDLVLMQLKETQRLLEKYFLRCQELEYQIMDAKR
ncbi:hypothetical protein ACJJIX_11790 [Microbulbifer sp. VAAC004]|uniref:hypothetical protein n=1 Tax=unclassified Microbulbifer TaxID=2619833 RepID=UPI00403982B8